MSQSMVLHLGALAKGREREASAQLVRARMHGRIGDTAQDTRTDTEQPQRK